MNYLTVGTNKISTDLFQNIENKSGPKPYGGIWQLHITNYTQVIMNG